MDLSVVGFRQGQKTKVDGKFNRSYKIEIGIDKEFIDLAYDAAKSVFYGNNSKVIDSVFDPFKYVGKFTAWYGNKVAVPFP
jgi:hypothetical protein